MNPDIFLDDFEITENTQELHAILGRCLIVATHFDLLCDHTSKFFKLKHVRTFNPVIENDTVDKNGKRCAFTYNQRYTTFDAITNATKTSEL